MQMYGHMKLRGISLPVFTDNKPFMQRREILHPSRKIFADRFSRDNEYRSTTMHYMRKITLASRNTYFLMFAFFYFSAQI